MRRCALAFCFLSGVLALAVMLIWVRSYRAGITEKVSLVLGGRRYSVHAITGTLSLRRPPPDPPPEMNRDVSKWVDALSNDDIVWRAFFRKSDHSYTGFSFRLATPREPVHQLYQIENSVAIPHLLRALEDPNKFAAAHVTLDLKMRDQRQVSAIQKKEYLAAGYDGLEAELRPISPRSASNSDPKFIDVICQGAPSVRYDAAQLPRIRELWHDRLDVTGPTVHLAVLMIVFLTPPFIWLWNWRRERRRKRRGHCANCGYDLRGGPKQCPECGLVTAEHIGVSIEPL